MTLTDGLDLGTMERSCHKKYTSQRAKQTNGVTDRQENQSVENAGVAIVQGRQ